MRLILVIFLLLISSSVRAEYNVTDTRIYNYSSNSHSNISYIGGSLRKVENVAEPELITVVNRHVLNSSDYKSDPSILISLGNSNIENKSEIIINKNLAETSIQRLDNIVRTIKYNSNPTTLWESRTPAQVQKDGNGNCFEVARLVLEYLKREGYLAKIVDIKFIGNKILHSVCVFQELDGTWSYFQANDYFVGYTRVSAKNIDELIHHEFLHIEKIIILK